MRTDLTAFLRALWRHWALLLTGGSLAAALAILQKAGIALPPAVDGIVIVVTLLAASFRAWREERRSGEANREVDSQRIAELEKAIIDAARLTPKLKVGGVHAPEAQSQHFSVYLDFENPGARSSVRPEVQLHLTCPDRPAVDLRGRLSSGTHVLEAGVPSPVYAHFDYGPLLPDRTALIGATLTITVTDIRHGSLSASSDPVSWV